MNVSQITEVATLMQFVRTPSAVSAVRAFLDTSVMDLFATVMKRIALEETVNALYFTLFATRILHYKHSPLFAITRINLGCSCES